MKIQIKFSKEEAEGFKNFCKIRPPEVDSETFYKQIFFAGCNAMSEQISALVEAHKAAQAAEAAKQENENEEEQNDEQAEEQLQD